MTLLLTGAIIVADNSFPQGKSYPTGQLILNDSAIGTREELVPEYEQLPSPANNPFWVRFIQDRDEWLIGASIAGLIIAYKVWPKRYTLFGKEYTQS